MNLAIRTKLTLLYATLLGVVMISFGWVLYFTLSTSLLDVADNKIKPIAQFISNTAVGQSETLGLPRGFDHILEQFFGLKTSDKYIQITNSKGVTVLKSSSLENFDLPISKDTYSSAHRGISTYETINLVGRYPIRVLTYPVMDGKRLKNLIEVGISLQAMEDSVNSLLFTLYLGIPLSLIAASVMGWLLAGRALKPVDEITVAARRISGKHLDERLELKGPKDEIRRLAETFNDMIARLEASFNRMKQFTLDVSHELRTPLTILKGETEMAIKDEKEVDGLRRVLMSNLEEVNRMARIVSDLLSISRMDMGLVTLHLKDVSLDKLIEEKYEQAKFLADVKRIEVTLLNNEPITVQGDHVKLAQLFLNLVENAVKYTPKEGKITLSLIGEHGFAEVRISDSGIGIAEADLPHIFDRFYRVDKVRSREAGGSGLGLSICKGIMEAHKGRIEVDSKPDKGTTFTVYLPLARPDQEASD